MLSVIGQLVNQKIAPGLDAGFRSKLIKLFWVTDRHFKDHIELAAGKRSLDDCYERTYDLCLVAVMKNPLRDCFEQTYDSGAVCVTKKPCSNLEYVPEEMWDEKMVFAVLNTLLMTTRKVEMMMILSVLIFNTQFLFQFTIPTFKLLM